MPKLSIIVPTFNSERTIERCLRSISAQKFRDYEVLVQDGRSTDATIEWVEKFGNANPEVEIRIVSEEDKGPYDAMNKGVREARGEWLYFLGSDDELHGEDVLGTIFARSELANRDVVYGDVRVVGDAGWAKDGALYDGIFDLPQLLRRNICHQAMFYRNSFHRKIGEYNLGYRVCADWDFNMRCWSRTSFEYVGLTVAKFYAGGASSNGDECFGRDFASIVLRTFALSFYDPLVNTPDFPGFDDIVRMQRSQGLLRRTVTKLRTAIHAGSRRSSRA